MFELDHAAWTAAATATGLTSRLPLYCTPKVTSAPNGTLTPLKRTAMNAKPWGMIMIPPSLSAPLYTFQDLTRGAHWAGGADYDPPASGRPLWFNRKAGSVEAILKLSTWSSGINTIQVQAAI